MIPTTEQQIYMAVKYAWAAMDTSRDMLTADFITPEIEASFTIITVALELLLENLHFILEEKDANTKN